MAGREAGFDGGVGFLLASVVLWASVVCSAEPAAELTAALAKARSIFEHPASPNPSSRLDGIVFARLKSLGIKPALCSDAVFVRRAYLDVIGTLPTAQQSREFIEDPSPDKRELLIDRLLARDEYADYWAMKWGDILRIKAEFPINLWPNAAQAYHRWVRASLAENKPYDKFVRELLTSSGSNFRVGPVNFYRAIQNRTPDGIAAAVALTFLGSRVDGWPEDRRKGLAAFFAQVGYKPTREWKEEHVFWDQWGWEVAAQEAARAASAGQSVDPPSATPSSANSAAAPTTKDAPPKALPPAPPREAVFPDGTVVQLPRDRDPREVFADWLIAPRNRWFTRCIVNRVWYWLLGRGIIHEPDDIRDDNPPSHPELLAYLEEELVAGNYELKRLYRIILTSQTYQLSSIPPTTAAEAEKHFACYVPRRLEAEVLIDAINAITGTWDLYTSPIPEPFTYIPREMRAIAIADGSITSPFLTLFGRSARATGMENERSNRPLPAQWLHVLNSSHIQRKIEQGPKLQALFESNEPPKKILEELYLTILSRFPTEEEAAIVEKHGGPPVAARASKGVPVKPRTAWIDIAWALINSPEFLYRH
jgi:hypothetical protein